MERLGSSTSGDDQGPRRGQQDAGGRSTRTGDSGGQRDGDSGVVWQDLTGFQRDVLMAIRRCVQDELVPTGQTIKDRLEVLYDEEINNGRLYQNLGQLGEYGLVQKGFVDGRTNTYSLAEDAAAMLDETAHEFADVCELTVAATNG